MTGHTGVTNPKHVASAPASSERPPKRRRLVPTDRVLGRGTFGEVREYSLGLCGKRSLDPDDLVSIRDEIAALRDLYMTETNEWRIPFPCGREGCSCVESIAKLAPRGIVPAYVAVSSLESPVILMHRASCSLMDYPRQTTDPARGLAAQWPHLFADLVAGLAHLHQRGRVHGDLVPRNVLCKQTPERTVLWLCDFGSSYTADHEDRHSGTTLTACSPEQIAAYHAVTQPLPKCTPACDVWAAACLVYFAVFGSVPFFHGDASRWGLFVNHCKVLGTPTDWSQYPPAWRKAEKYAPRFKPAPVTVPSDWGVPSGRKLAQAALDACMRRLADGRPVDATAMGAVLGLGD